MAKTGRPRKEIDFAQFEAMCHIQCTEVEIASILGISVDTLERRCEEHYGSTFAEVYEEKRSHGKESLRRKQWHAAENGNITMMIWLGKQWLGQTDTQKIEHSGAVHVHFDKRYEGV